MALYSTSIDKAPLGNGISLIKFFSLGIKDEFIFLPILFISNYNTLYLSIANYLAILPYYRINFINSLFLFENLEGRK
nr:hypothetical protein GTC16762_21960 [Pigmentibacter ruber]